MALRPRVFTASKPIRARRFAWLAAVLACGAAGAQPLTADDAVRLAFEQPVWQADERAELDAARSEVTAARTWPNPELRAERERGRGAIADTTETTVVIAQEFDLTGRRGLQRRAAELGVEATAAEVAAGRLRTRADVLEVYFDAVAAEQRVRGLDDVLTALDELQRVAARRHEAGDLSGFESRRIAQAAMRTRLRRDAHEAARIAARERLAAWVGPQARDASLDLDAPLPPMPAAAADATSAEVAALRLRAEQAEATTRAASRWALPVTVGIGQKHFETSGARDRALIVEAAVPLPLFDRNQAQAQRARAEAERAHARLEIAQRQIRAQRAGAAAEATRLAATARTLREDVVPQAQQLGRIAAASFSEGELDLVGLLETLDAQIDAVEQSIDLQQQARQALLELETLTLGDVP